jgi:hypothetical protein
MWGEMKGWLETGSLVIVILALTSHNICSRTSFLRADTEKFRALVTEWMDLDIVSEWNGKFTTDDPNGECNNEFFGLPSQPPFYVGNGGIDWSAMPCHATDIWTFGRGVFNSSRHISGVEYDSGRAPLASTSRCDDAKFDFLVDHVLFQAGGIVIRYTPGFKAAAFRNGTAKHLISLLDQKQKAGPDNPARE